VNANDARDARGLPPGAPAGVTRLAPVIVPGPAGSLEGLLQERDEHDHPIAAVVCHPHPLYGGTLHNKVTHRLASTLHGLGAASLRFNFRGVGGSEGTHDRGIGELEDARAALHWLRDREPKARLWIAGFSFGSWIAARLAAESPEVAAVILVAPSIRNSNFESMYTCATPKLVFQGDADTVCPPEFLEQDFPRWAPPKRKVMVSGASHFFDRRLGELAEALTVALREEGWI
jgi:alpha/beta superfamily hydrolase